MKLLVLSVDPVPNGIPLREKSEPSSTRWPVDLPAPIKDKLMSWNDRFGDLISAEHLYDAEQIATLTSLLNAEGARLAEMINCELLGIAKVEFFPE